MTATSTVLVQEFATRARRGGEFRGLPSGPGEKVAVIGRITHARELPSAGGLSAGVPPASVIPSTGHTDCDMPTATAAFAQAASSDPGRSLATHLFNGMPHRRTALELVADGVHLDDDTAAVVCDLVGPGQVALVTAAMAAESSATPARSRGLEDVTGAPRGGPRAGALAGGAGLTPVQVTGGGRGAVRRATR